MTLTITNQLISDEAKKLWIRVNIISEKHNLLELDYNWDKKVIRRSRIPSTSWVLGYIADNKESTYDVMDHYWFSYPKSIVSKEFWILKTAITSFWFPLVIKPERWAHWKWVTTGINSEDELKDAFDLAKKFDSEIIVQKYFIWDDYRILVVWTKLRAVAKRNPARVFWNWKSSIEQLIETENKNPKRWNWHTAALTKIVIDKDMLELLKSKSLDLKYIPINWEEVFLRKIWNLSQGWEAEDVTDNIADNNIKLFEKIAKSLNASIVWIDILANDLSKDLTSEDYVVIEVNVSPWIRMHHFPSKWKPRNIALNILEDLYHNIF